MFWPPLHCVWAALGGLLFGSSILLLLLLLLLLLYYCHAHTCFPPSLSYASYFGIVIVVLVAVAYCIMPCIVVEVLSTLVALILAPRSALLATPPYLPLHTTTHYALNFRFSFSIAII